MRMKTSFEMWTYNNLMCKAWQDVVTGEWVWAVTSVVETTPLAGGLAKNQDNAKSKAQGYCGTLVER